MLILAEKPSVARDFAAALDCRKKDGFFEGDNHAVTFCVGHLFELYNPDDYDPRYEKWRLEDLPIIPQRFRYKINEGVKEQAERVLSLLKERKSGDVLIATDAGREGELIARITLLEAGVTDISRFRRFWVSEALTKEVILAGIQNAKPLSEYDPVCAQGFARARSDWLLGMNLSRLMSIGNPPPAFSVGRVQTAVLSAIHSRNAEVKNFIATPYKELSARVFDSKDGALTAALENPETNKSAFFEKDEPYLQEAFAFCKDKKVTSADVKSEQKKTKPEKLFNITGLQKAAYKKHGYKPEETLNIAQALYETHKCLSYPRTPSRVMGDNNAGLFKEKFELLKDSSPLSAFCDASLIDASNKHIFNSAQLEDHHALIPLNVLPKDVNEKERNIYTLVLESFFTVCMPDFIYNEKSICFHVDKYGHL